MRYLTARLWLGQNAELLLLQHYKWRPPIETSHACRFVCGCTISLYAGARYYTANCLFILLNMQVASSFHSLISTRYMMLHAEYPSKEEEEGKKKPICVYMRAPSVCIEHQWMLDNNKYTAAPTKWRRERERAGVLFMINKLLVTYSAAAATSSLTGVLFSKWTVLP